MPARPDIFIFKTTSCILQCCYLQVEKGTKHEECGLLVSCSLEENIVTLKIEASSYRPEDGPYSLTNPEKFNEHKCQKTQ